MVDRYSDWQRRSRREDEDEDRYSGWEYDRGYGGRAGGRGYGYGDYGQGYRRSYREDEDLYNPPGGGHGYSYGDYGQGNQRDYGYNRERYNNPSGGGRGYSYGDYGQDDYGRASGYRRDRYDYGRPRRYDRDYELEQGRDYGWGTTRDYDYDRYGTSTRRGRGYGADYGGYGRDYRRNYGFDPYRSQTEWGSGRSEPATWSYTEVWLIPGPETGQGPMGYQRASDRIIEDVCERLTQHGQVNARNIQIECADNGIVTLKGTVRSRREKRMAEETAESVAGVRDVQNQLQVQESLESQERQGQEQIQRGRQIEGQRKEQ